MIYARISITKWGINSRGEMSVSVVSVFVYGTLRSGGSNHFRMAGAKFTMTASVRGRLYGIDWFPGLILDASGGEIVGEVYEVEAVSLDSLDAFEGPQYRRVMADLCTNANEPSAQSAWLWEWLGPVDESRRILTGDWFSYQPIE